MLAILPTLFVDQTLYSWCGLAHMMNGGTSARESSNRLFGAPHAGLCHDFPAYLATLTRRTHGQLGSPRDLALRHTLLGYFLPTLESEKAEEIVSVITENAIPSLKMRLGITASRVGGHHPLKLCPDCSAEEQQRHGYSYWHIDHQFPSSFVCLRHMRPLVILRDSTTPVHRRTWLTPDDYRRAEPVEIRVASDSALATLRRLALDSREMSLLTPGALSAEHATAGYQRILRELNLATKRGNLRVGKLVSLVRERYRGLEDLPGLASLSSLGAEWPGLVASLSRRASRPGHPLKHLLLVGAITGSWAEFLQACEIGCKTNFTTPGNHSRLTRDKDFRLFEHSLNAGNISVSQASKIVGISTTTGVQWAELLGASFTHRRKVVTYPLAVTVRKQLSAGETIGTIAVSCGLSCSTVNRILGADVELQAARRKTLFAHKMRLARIGFSKACKRHSDLPLSELRKFPGNGYAWLYRNDRPWLSQKLSRLGRPFGVTS